MTNPFKYGSIVEGDYFTDRVEEVAYIKHFVESSNHLIIISPLRYGKTSMTLKAVKATGRPYIMLNLQGVTSVNDLSAKLLREMYKIHPMERLRQFLIRFRIVPTLTTNPITGAIDIEFNAKANPEVMLEDVMGLIESSSNEGARTIVILDEFQEIREIGDHLDKKMRTIMQMQQRVNYILLGSQVSMMEEIFEQKKSPFYHFGQLMRLKKIPHEDFEQYLYDRLPYKREEERRQLARAILEYTGCHPYYTQQLASQLWQQAMLGEEVKDPMTTAIEQIAESHSMDYERLWMNFNRTDRWILSRLAKGQTVNSPEYRPSTIYSALRKLQRMGYIVREEGYAIEDPYFKEWIVRS